MPFSNSLIRACGFLLVLGSVLASPTTETPSASNACNLTQSLALSTTEASNHDPRTVWSILWSCITTIIACCWIAVHPNMLEADATFWRSTTHRLSHMGWMIIAPELMICWALRQWLGARKLMKKAPYNVAPTAWSMTHGYFLQMGGFVLEGKEPDILSAERLEDLIDKNEIALPNITAKEIKDRSKRDGLSKTIGIGQTTWFLAQCITRKAQGLTTTELELVTIAFAALNVFLYIFWWDKPMDVQTTVMVRYLAKLEVHSDAERDEKGGICEIPVLQKTNSRLSQKKKGASTDSLSPSKKESIKMPAEKSSFLRFIGRSILALITLPSTAVQTLFKRVSAMLFDSPKIKPGMKKIFTFYALDTTDDEQAIIMVSVCVMGIIFGGIHCVGWNYFFPTHAESVIWRVSSISLIAVPGLMTAGAFLALVGAIFDDCIEIVSNIFFGFAGMSVVLGVVGVVPYVVARILLIVEAFISLRDLPPDALLAVRWTSFLPHY